MLDVHCLLLLFDGDSAVVSDMECRIGDGVAAFGATHQHRHQAKSDRERAFHFRVAINTISKVTIKTQMHQHISCGAPIFLWRDNVGEHSEQLGALGATPTIVLAP